MSINSPSKTAERNIKFAVPLSGEIGETPVYLWLNDKTEVLVVRSEGRLRILSSICPHMGAQLRCDGSKKKIHCPWHGLTFPLQTLSSGHQRYRHLKEYEGEIIEGKLVIYGGDG
jgi:nitrite reductase/ring-hydroxylating ferredoxin subunit